MFGSQEVFREGKGCLRVREFEAEKKRRSFRSQGASNRFSEVKDRATRFEVRDLFFLVWRRVFGEREV